MLKRFKITYGYLFSYINRKSTSYDDIEWWDRSFYTEGISDSRTIAPKKSVLTSRYHYASMEMLILRHLRNNSITLKEANILDVGSGAGHWIDFYKTLNPASITGVDVSVTSYEFLKQTYSEDAAVDVHHGKALDLIARLENGYDLVNAIGVMFHIVDDAEWKETVTAIGDVLNPGGLLIAGGHFGYLGRLNVQIDDEGKINKRLRSRRLWIRTLKRAGFSKIRIYRNKAYLWIKDIIPENNVLIAAK